MATVPICPVHGSPMRQGKGGSFFCPKKADDGTWCDQRVAAQQRAAAPAAPASGQSAPAGGPDSNTLLVIAAMDMAAKVYQGTGPNGEQDALNFMSRAYALAKSELDVL